MLSLTQCTCSAIKGLADAAMAGVAGLAAMTHVAAELVPSGVLVSLCLL